MTKKRRQLKLGVRKRRGLVVIYRHRNFGRRLYTYRTRRAFISHRRVRSLKLTLFLRGNLVVKSVHRLGIRQPVDGRSRARPPFYHNRRHFSRVRRRANFWAWDLRRQFLIPEKIGPTQFTGRADQNNIFINNLIRFEKRIKLFSKFFRTQQSIKCGKEAVQLIRRRMQAIPYHVSQYAVGMFSAAKYGRYLNSLKRLSYSYSSVYNNQWSNMNRAIYSPSFLLNQVFYRLDRYRNIFRYFSTNLPVKRILKLRVLLDNSRTALSIFDLPTFFKDAIKIRRTLSNHAAQRFMDGIKEHDWDYFWTRLTGFKWFFEYRRWRRCYQLAFWFKRLRSYRKIKKERFYLKLFRLFFFYLGGINESNIINMWKRYYRLDNRYGTTIGGRNRFLQMLQLRISNLLVFLGLAVSSFNAIEASKVGIIRLNGFTKLNPYSMVGIGDIIQLNLDSAFYYTTLFSTLYWVRVESQVNFVGFLQSLFSMLLFTVIRWPRSYELSETDTRLSRRMMLQILRLLPYQSGKYVPIKKTKKNYSLHFNIVKIFRHKYRQSRHYERKPMIDEFTAYEN